MKKIEEELATIRSKIITLLEQAVTTQLPSPLSNSPLEDSGSMTPRAHSNKRPCPMTSPPTTVSNLYIILIELQIV
jgi:hypothetical protein